MYLNLREIFLYMSVIDRSLHEWVSVSVSESGQ